MTEFSTRPLDKLTAGCLPAPTPRLCRRRRVWATAITVGRACYLLLLPLLLLLLLLLGRMRGDTNLKPGLFGFPLLGGFLRIEFYLLKLRYPTLYYVNDNCKSWIAYDEEFNIEQEDSGVWSESLWIVKLGDDAFLKTSIYLQHIILCDYLHFKKFYTTQSASRSL